MGRVEKKGDYERAKPYLASIFFRSFSDIPSTLFFNFSTAAANAFSTVVFPSPSSLASSTPPGDNTAFAFEGFLDFFALIGEGELCGRARGGSYVNSFVEGEKSGLVVVDVEGIGLFVRVEREAEVVDFDFCIAIRIGQQSNAWRNERGEGRGEED